MDCEALSWGILKHTAAKETWPRDAFHHFPFILKNDESLLSIVVMYQSFLYESGVSSHYMIYHFAGSQLVIRSQKNIVEKKNKKPLSWFIFKSVAPPFIIKGLSFVFHLAKSIPKTLLISCQVDEVAEDIYVCFYHHMVDAFKCFSGRVNLCKHHVASFVFVAFCHHARATLMFCWLLKCLWYMISCAKRRFFGRKLIFGTCALEQDTGMCLNLFWFAAEILEPDGTYSRLFSVLFFFFALPYKIK